MEKRQKEGTCGISVVVVVLLLHDGTPVILGGSRFRLAPWSVLFYFAETEFEDLAYAKCERRTNDFGHTYKCSG